MTGYGAFDVVMLVASGILILGSPSYLIVCGTFGRVQTWRARRWLRQTVDGGRSTDVDLVRPVLAGRDRARGWASLVAVLLAVALAPPDPVTDYSPSDNLGLWFTALLAGFWIGGFARAVVEILTARTPEGVRVAASAPHRMSWYASRAALLALALAIAAQATRGVVRIRQVWPWEGLADASLATIAALGAMITMTVAILIMTPWLVSRPVHAGDDHELDLQIELRREHIRTSLAVMYALVFSVGFMIDTIVTDDVPFEVRRNWSGRWNSLSIVAILLAFCGLMLQQRLNAQWAPPVPPAATDDGTAGGGSWPDSWEPAPGTDGWIFSRRARRSAH